MDGIQVGKVLRLKYISRDMIQADRDTIFVFGDNMAGKGLGGQAKTMRGEPNSIGVPTKWRPDRGHSAYFTDEDIKNRDVWHAIHDAFERIRAAIASGRNVVIPEDGLGTGLSELPTRAPKLHAMIERAIASLDPVPETRPEASSGQRALSPGDPTN